MENSNYEPPKQSAFGQFFDSLFCWSLVFAALFAPLYLRLAGGGKTELAVADKTTWEGLGQNAVQQAQWEKLGLTPETAAPDDHVALRLQLQRGRTRHHGGRRIGYFALAVRVFARREYREVIEERFGKK